MYCSGKEVAVEIEVENTKKRIDDMTNCTM